jgi:hypothetical protein
MKKRFQSYIYDQLKKKDNEIADLLYPGDNSNIDRIEKHILDAKKLKDNALSDDNFPGSF